MYFFLLGTNPWILKLAPLPGQCLSALRRSSLAWLVQMGKSSRTPEGPLAWGSWLSVKLQMRKETESCCALRTVLDANG
jgi:hypothetical protein